MKCTLQIPISTFDLDTENEIERLKEIRERDKDYYALYPFLTPPPISVERASKNCIDELISTTIGELNPVMQRLDPILSSIRSDQNWTWITTSGNKIRVSVVDEHVKIDLDTRRCAMSNSYNGVGRILNAIEKHSIPRKQWIVEVFESSSDADWHLWGVSPRSLSDQIGDSW